MSTSPDGGFRLLLNQEQRQEKENGGQPNGQDKLRQDF
jgi:hypothetical protein